MRRAVLTEAVFVVAMLWTTLASAQIPPVSGCADCHFANPRAPRREHLFDWDRSPHARNNVGCQSCHGGNPQTFERMPAHAGILGPDNAKSPVNRRNLPATCGTCHTGPYVAFQDSQHYKLLQSNTYQPSACQEIDLLRPVWVITRPLNRVPGRVLLQRGLRFQFWCRVEDAVPNTY